jgi:Lrp/AsnC family transcriptional regulator
VIAKDMSDYQRIYRELILTLPHIADIEALMHIARIKSDEVLPV